MLDCLKECLPCPAQVLLSPHSFKKVWLQASPVPNLHRNFPLDGPPCCLNVVRVMAVLVYKVNRMVNSNVGVLLSRNMPYKVIGGEAVGFDDRTGPNKSEEIVSESMLVKKYYVKKQAQHLALTY